ncbi:ribosomal protein S12 methylthiotransferase accessory factor [Syntrophus gentianae]|uniref:Ribosomal protein S12 methylthiotransferase accessory factor n=1 Tax=Syntrophus gentianae TaxID=43775 RepID=A0A1H7ZNI5_9BACT|nr:TOMM precursor leader peptide-binding protein [Syntrophus gentianae]SEM59905.1 ribosomal protein S12 methylthiotransferase accessory factor [Syntrophus gentianae]
MGTFKIKEGVVPIPDGNGRWVLLDERGPGRISSPLSSELISMIRRGLGDEDDLAAALENRFPPEEVYFTLINLEKQGVIVQESVQQGNQAYLFLTRILGRERSGPPLSPLSPLVLRVFAIGGTDSSVDALAASLSRSDVLTVERLPDGYRKEIRADAVYVAVIPDALEPELEAFGLFAQKRELRWVIVKPKGVVQQIGPLFLPGETGCVACLLDRIRGHRRLEWGKILKEGNGQSLRLSVGQTVFSLETVAGLLAGELEKLAAGGTSELAGSALTLDFQNLRLDRHPLPKRPQCPVCGTRTLGTFSIDALPKEPLQLQSRIKADYRDGGERICSAVETLEKYACLISPITGVVSQLTLLKKSPPCFGHVVRSDWIVRKAGKVLQEEQNSRLTATGFSTGKGRTVPQAKASALGEAIERYSSQYEGYEPCVRASFAELGDLAISPVDLMGFSQQQYRDRTTWRQWGNTAYVPDPYDARRPIDWTPAWSLTQHRWRLIPSAFAYYFYPQEGGGDICRSCSNGVAAGNCLEEAIMQGFFELIERDATAMWWYHKLRRPAVDLHSFDSPFAAAVDAAMDEMGMRLEVLDLTNDLGLPVFSAILFTRQEGGRFHSIGLGCHHDPLIALERTLSELGQCWGLADRDKYSLQFQDAPLSREHFLQAAPLLARKSFSDFSGKQQKDFLTDIDEAVRLLGARGLEMLVLDLTRPDIRFPVARVIVPGLLHFWPRFGCRRLFEVPKASGWIDEGADEESLNPVPFFL